MTTTRTQQLHDQEATKKAIYAAKRRIAAEGFFTGASTGAMLGLYFAPLFPPLLIICPAVGAVLGTIGGYWSSKKAIAAVENENTNPKKPHKKFVIGNYMTTAGLIGTTITLAIVALCPPIGLTLTTLTIGLGTGAGAIAGMSLAMNESSNEVKSKLRTLGQSINIGAAIGATIGFFIPLPGATFIGAFIGGALGGIITASYQYYKNRKPSIFSKLTEKGSEKDTNADDSRHEQHGPSTACVEQPRYESTYQRLQGHGIQSRDPVSPTYNHVLTDNDDAYTTSDDIEEDDATLIKTSTANNSPPSSPSLTPN